jgi:hypothetical protein
MGGLGRGWTEKEHMVNIWVDWVEGGLGRGGLRRNIW